MKTRYDWPKQDVAMNQTQIIIAIIGVLIAAAAIIILLRRVSKQSPYKAVKESMPYQAGSIRHPELPASFITRIRKFEEIFAEIYPITHEEWLDGFKRDANPEREIAIWEQMASAYTRFLNTGNFTAEVRKEAFGILLVRSGSTDVESLFSNFTHLTEAQARNLLSLYEADAQPVTFISGKV